jgi:hypothetical protein
MSEDMFKVIVEIPLSYKNRNYVGTIFGGSLFSATDPVYMMQLIHILGNEYVIWDKSATIHYRKPATEKAIALFEFKKEEIEQIIQNVKRQKEIAWKKELVITNTKGDIFCLLERELYIADRFFYQEKMRIKKELENKQNKKEVV